MRDGTDARDDVWVVALLIFTVMLTSLSLAITLCFLTEEAPTSTLTWLICVG